MIGNQPGPEEFTLEIAGKEFRYWSSVDWTSSVDSFDTVSFVAPFDPDDESHRTTFQPFSYKSVKLKLGGELVFTGFMMGVDPEVTADSRQVTVSAYASAAALGDFKTPSAVLPLEFEKLTLQQIASQLGKPFFLTPSFTGSPGAPFDRVKVEPDKTPLSLLQELAKQRGLVIRSNAEGNPVFLQSATGPQIPRAVLNGREQPVVSVRPTFDHQNYYSEITVVSKPKTGRKGSKFTVFNPVNRGELARPHYIELDDTNPADAPTAAKAALGRMFGNAVTYEVDLATMLDPQGQRWKADTFVSLIAPDAMIYNRTSFLVSQVKLSATADSRSASLSLVLPGAFSGEAPTTFPWDA